MRGVRQADIGGSELTERLTPNLTPSKQLLVRGHRTNRAQRGAKTPRQEVSGLENGHKSAGAKRGVSGPLGNLLRTLGAREAGSGAGKEFLRNLRSGPSANPARWLTVAPC